MIDKYVALTNEELTRPETLAKLDRMEKIYATVQENPQAMTDEMAAQRQRLEALKTAKGEYISPLDL